MSSTRKRYVMRLIARIIILIIVFTANFLWPQSFIILEGNNFFRMLSPFHLLWVVWMIDMILQIIPLKNKVALGSQKLFAHHFRPIREKMSSSVLKKHALATAKGAYKVFVIWVLFIAIIAGIYYAEFLDKKWMLTISVAFYVCDLICVLIWCPFRLIMKNKCCTTCRIFNWDHIMMFSPLIFIGGFYGISLVVMAVLAWLVWEISALLYPERFHEITNVALKCSECTDKLCTQYCKKLR